MTHVRKQIRDRIAAIVQGGTVPNSRIFTSRAYPMDSAGGNAICVYATSSDHETSAMGLLPEAKRNVTQTVMVECWASGPSATIDDAIDLIAEYVEDRISSDPTLGGLVKNTQMIGDQTDINVDGGIAIGSVSIEYRVTYRRTGAEAGVTIA